jgi:hypothetical protein
VSNKEVEFVPSFDNFNASNIFHRPRFQPWEKKNQNQKNQTRYKPVNSITDFIFFLKIVHRHRLQTGANKIQTGAKHHHRQTKIPTFRKG